MILIYTTHSSKEEAVKVSNDLFTKKLIACVNYIPMESSYEWKGEVRTEQEMVALYKADEQNWKSIKTAILEIHPYETPCIIKIKAEANESFENWVSSAK